MNGETFRSRTRKNKIMFKKIITELIMTKGGSYVMYKINFALESLYLTMNLIGRVHLN